MKKSCFTEQTIVRIILSFRKYTNILSCSILHSVQSSGERAWWCEFLFFQVTRFTKLTERYD